MTKSIKETLVSGKLARLIPVVADSKKEERATASLLASFMVVPAFASDVLSDLGASMGKRTVVEGYTEVCFKAADKTKNCRPDGLIIVTSGSKIWTALIEAKTGNAIHTKEQVETYLDLARAHGINAVITLSNQYAITPRHHPIVLAKQKTKHVDVFHYSWLSLISKAVLITDNKKVEDPEQAYILSELVRYYRHESSGVTHFTRMDGAWKNVCTAILQNAPLSKSSSDVTAAIVSWQQLLKYLALDLSMKIGQPVALHLSRTQANELELKFQEDCDSLVQQHCLSAALDIPNAAAKLTIHADFVRRTLNFSMKLDAPKDRTRATASVNWFTRQLKGKKNIEDLVLRANWPRRRPDTAAPLVDLFEKPELLVPEGASDTPSSFEITRVVDLMSRFKGAQTFVEDASHNITAFYHDVGQHLSRWVAKAPKIKEKAAEQPTIPTIMSGVTEISEIEDSPSPESVEQTKRSFLGRMLNV
ncbi:hypothetical protein QGM61_06505 [Pseudohongiella sp. SYSU M77423]|uniref:hypothetical protein n=1 Tax=Pseudohongiella sp. SYSU M77423 TaxID=3042312 RepID=UPI002480ADD8|nr:hypothetical protein [Pseudohongiella sp. SYSU M77423]MDH7943466.1 hypothetical protein [Pseudohongiella sp. SYSU M77423]